MKRIKNIFYLIVLVLFIGVVSLFIPHGKGTLENPYLLDSIYSDKYDMEVLNSYNSLSNIKVLNDYTYGLSIKPNLQLDNIIFDKIDYYPTNMVFFFQTLQNNLSFENDINKDYILKQWNEFGFDSNVFFDDYQSNKLLFSKKDLQVFNEAFLRGNGVLVIEYKIQKDDKWWLGYSCQLWEEHLYDSLSNTLLSSKINLPNVFADNLITSNPTQFSPLEGN